MKVTSQIVRPVEIYQGSQVKKTVKPKNNTLKTYSGRNVPSAKQGITKSLRTAKAEARPPLGDLASGLALIRALRGFLKGKTSLVEFREREHRLEDEARTRKLSRHFRAE